MDIAAAELCARQIRHNCKIAIGELTWYGLTARGNRGYQGSIATIDKLVSRLFEHLDYCGCCFRKRT